MEKEKINQKLNMYNAVIHEDKCIRKAEKWANVISSISFALLLGLGWLFLLTWIAYYGTNYGNFANSANAYLESAHQAITNIVGILPFIDADIGFWKFILYIVYMYSIPIGLGYLTYYIVRAILLAKKPGAIDDSPDSFKKLAQEFNNPRRSDISLTIIGGLFILVSSIIALAVLCYKDNILGMIMLNLLPLILGLAAAVIFVVKLLLKCFRALQEKTVLSVSKHKNFEFNKMDFEKLCSDIRKEEEAKKKAEAERIRQEEEKRKEQERLRIVSEAEAEFQALENPEDNEKLVKKLANKESPSACLYLGRKLYQKFTTQRLTKSEKERLAAECEEYLVIATNAGNIEAEFLLLDIATETESNSYETWVAYLKEARTIKASGKLPEHYHDTMDGLIDTLIEVVDRMEEKRADAIRETNRKPVIKREYCRFMVAGQCGHGGYISPCRYINNPGNCSIALNEKGLAFEFE